MDREEMRHLKYRIEHVKYLLKYRIEHVKYLKELLNKKDLKLIDLYKARDGFRNPIFVLSREDMINVIDNKLDSDKFIRKEIKLKLKNIEAIVKQDSDKLKDYFNTIKDILKE